MTGMRQGKQFGLTWDKVDLDSGTLRLEGTKNRKGRFARLNSRALTVMRALHEFSLGPPRVFVLNRKPRWELVTPPVLAQQTWFVAELATGSV